MQERTNGSATGATAVTSKLSRTHTDPAGATSGSPSIMGTAAIDATAPG